MQIDLISALVFLITTVAAVTISFYIKDFLQIKNEYSKLRKKLEKVAGKQATILYAGTGFGPGAANQLFKIIDIDGHGITLQNELQTVFVPAKKLLQADMIVPCDNYEQAKLDKMKKDMEQFMDSMMPAMFDRLFPALEKAVKDHFLDDIISEKGEVGAIIGVKIQKVLSEEGFEIKKVDPSKSDQ